MTTHHESQTAAEFLQTMPSTVTNMMTSMGYQPNKGLGRKNQGITTSNEITSRSRGNSRQCMGLASRDLPDEQVPNSDKGAGKQIQSIMAAATTPASDVAQTTASSTLPHPDQVRVPPKRKPPGDNTQLPIATMTTSKRTLKRPQALVQQRQSEAATATMTLTATTPAESIGTATHMSSQIDRGQPATPATTHYHMNAALRAGTHDGNQQDVQERAHVWRQAMYATGMIIRNTVASQTTSVPETSIHNAITDPNSDVVFVKSKEVSIDGTYTVHTIRDSSAPTSFTWETTIHGDADKQSPDSVTRFRIIGNAQHEPALEHSVSGADEVLWTSDGWTFWNTSGVIYDDHFTRVTDESNRSYWALYSTSQRDVNTNTSKLSFSTAALDVVEMDSTADSGNTEAKVNTAYEKDPLFKEMLERMTITPAPDANQEQRMLTITRIREITKYLSPHVTGSRLQCADKTISTLVSYCADKRWVTSDDLALRLVKLLARLAPMAQKGTRCQSTIITSLCRVAAENKNNTDTSIAVIVKLAVRLLLSTPDEEPPKRLLKSCRHALTVAQRLNRSRAIAVATTACHDFGILDVARTLNDKIRD